MALLMSGELEVLKHAQARFLGAAMAAPHPRILFVDEASTAAAELRWCVKEDFARRHFEGRKGGATLRKGLPLKHLLDVSRRSRVVTLLFKERPLVVEAYTEERAAVIEACFRYVLSKNKRMSA